MAQAFITKIHQKQTSFGTMYDFEFSDGNRIGAGKFLPKGFAEGDYVQYEYDMKGQYKNLRSGSMSKIDKPAGVATPAPAKTSFSRNDDKRQEIISKQAALNSAISYITLLQTTGALPVPAAAKKDKLADLMLGILNHYTAHFYKQATGEDLSFDEPASLADAEAKDVDWQSE